MTRWILALAAVAVLGAGCGGGGTTEGGDGGGATATDSLTMVDNEFQPADIAVTSGSTLTVTNDGQAAHTFTLEDGSIDETVAPGASTEVDISLSAGDYPYECTFHPGMGGTLTVE